MEIKNTNVVVAIILLLVGGVLGWALSAKNYNQGPLAGVNSMQSQANVDCADLSRKYWAAVDKGQWILADMYGRMYETSCGELPSKGNGFSEEDVMYAE